MLKIILGYRGHSTDENPAVLFAGHCGDAAQEAADSAPEEFVRLTRLDGPQERTARRNRKEIVSAMPGTTPATAVAVAGDGSGAAEVTVEVTPEVPVEPVVEEAAEEAAADPQDDEPPVRASRGRRSGSKELDLSGEEN